MTILCRGKNGSPQKRAVRSNGWTKAKRAAFLDVLAATCNVRDAARAAGMSSTGAYQLRRRDDGFAALWAEALEGGYLRLEDELLAYALGQAVQEENPDAERAEPPRAVTGPFDPELAMKVLKLRMPTGRGARRRARPAATQEEVDAELMKRLGALAHRLGNTA